MTAACAPIDPNQALAERLASYVDCHAQALGQAAFADSSVDWLVPALLAGCLTIYVALIGYRLLLGEGLGPRDAVMAVVRAGVVIAFASSWSAYETLAYRVVIDGPSEIAGQLLAPLGLGPMSLPEIAGRVDADYAKLVALQAPRQPPAVAGVPASPAQAAPAPASPTRPGPGDQDRTMSSWGALLVVSVIGGLAAVRLIGGVLLAIGPIAIVLALFDALLGLFEGWVRAVAGAVLASAGAMLVAALELDFIDSQLVSAGGAADSSAQLSGPAIATLSWIFSAITLAVIVVGFAVGRGFRFPRGRSSASAQGAAATMPRTQHFAATRARSPEPEMVSRAHGIANAIIRTGERERLSGSGVQPSFGFVGGAAGGRSPGANDVPVAGRAAASRRSVAPPRTASAGRRDSRK